MKQTAERKVYLAQWRKANPEKAAEYGRKWRSKNPIKYWLASVRRGAKQRGLEFSISEADLSPMPECCPVLGCKLDYSKGPFVGRNKRLNVASDRVDNVKGYVPGNVVIISLRANYLKKDATVAELRALADFYTNLERSRAIS